MEVLPDLRVFVYSDVVLPGEMKLFCRHLKCVLQLQCPTRHIQVSGAHCELRDNAEEEVAQVSRLGKSPFLRGVVSALSRCANFPASWRKEKGLREHLANHHLAKHLRDNTPTSPISHPLYDWFIPVLFLPQAHKVHGLAGTHTALELITRICHRGSTIGMNVLASTLPKYNKGYLNTSYLNRQLRESSEAEDRRWVCDLYEKMARMSVEERGWTTVGALLAEFIGEREREWDTAEGELGKQLVVDKKMPSWDYYGVADLHDDSVFSLGQDAIPSSPTASPIDLAAEQDRITYLSRVERILPKLRRKLTNLYLERVRTAPKVSRTGIFRPKRTNAIIEAIDTSVPDWWCNEELTRDIADSLEMPAEWRLNDQDNPIDLIKVGNPLAQETRMQNGLIDLKQNLNPLAQRARVQNPLYQVARGRRVVAAQAEENPLRVSIEKADTPCADDSGAPIGGSSTSSGTTSGSSSRRSASTISNLNSKYDGRHPPRDNKRRGSSSSESQNDGKRQELLIPAVAVRKEDTEMDGMGEGERGARKRRVSWIAKHFAETYPSSSEASSRANSPAASVHATTPRPSVAPSPVHESDEPISQSRSAHSTKPAAPHILDPLSTTLSGRDPYHATAHSYNTPHAPSPFTTAEDIDYTHMLMFSNTECVNPKELIDWMGRSHREAAEEREVHLDLRAWQATQAQAHQQNTGGFGTGLEGGGGEDFIMGGMDDDWGAGGGGGGVPAVGSLDGIAMGGGGGGRAAAPAAPPNVPGFGARFGELIFDKRRVIRTPSWSPITTPGVSGRGTPNPHFQFDGTQRVRVPRLKRVPRKLLSSNISSVERRGVDRSSESSLSSATSSQSTSGASSSGETSDEMRVGMVSIGSGQSTPNALFNEDGRHRVKVPRPKWVPRKPSSFNTSAVESRGEPRSSEPSSDSGMGSQGTSTASTGGQMRPPRASPVPQAPQPSEKTGVSCLQALQTLRALQASQLLQPHQIPSIWESSQRQASQALQTQRPQALQIPEALPTVQASQASQVWQAPRPLIPPQAPQSSRVPHPPVPQVLEISQASPIPQAPQPSQASQGLPQALISAQAVQKSPQLGPAFGFSSMAQWAKSMKEKGVKFAPE